MPPRNVTLPPPAPPGVTPQHHPAVPASPSQHPRHPRSTSVTPPAVPAGPIHPVRLGPSPGSCSPRSIPNPAASTRSESLRSLMRVPL
ncbi:hypothetical protein BN2537_4361 [Streptomyces venezuelae]|nr:hypothetical protein BN2537_4361 [Streptomyces venezuelae]